MTPEQLRQLFSGDLVPLIIKGFLLFIIFLYAIFAAVVLRQIQNMNKVIAEAGFSPLLTTIAVVHFAAVAVVFILAVILI